MKRQRVLFIKENYILRILKNFMIAGLFIIALLLILVHKIDLGVISGVSKGVFYVTSPLIHMITLPAEGLNLAYRKTSEIINIYQENIRLKKENEGLFLLKDQIKAVKAENTILKKLLHHYELPHIKTHTAHVIGKTGNAFTNSVIIYLGENASEVKSGYPVVNAHGLVGRIDFVSGKYARVTLITDINSKIPVVSQKSRDRGILVGNNTDDLKLIFSPLMAELHKGDLLVTSNAGGGLPSDIPVARIQSIALDKITAKPLFKPSEIEIVKILFYEDSALAKIPEELE